MKQKRKLRKRKHTQATQRRRSIPLARGMLTGNKIKQQHSRTGLISIAEKADL